MQLAFHIVTKVVFGFAFIDNQMCAVSIVSFHYTHINMAQEKVNRHMSKCDGVSAAPPTQIDIKKKQIL